MEQKETIELIYKFLNNISNTVGNVITEYHWREAEELKLLLRQNFDIIDNPPTINIQEDEPSKDL